MEGQEKEGRDPTRMNVFVHRDSDTSVPEKANITMDTVEDLIRVDEAGRVAKEYHLSDDDGCCPGSSASGIFHYIASQY